MFSQILDFDKVIKTFTKYHKVFFFKKIRQDFQQISNSKLKKKKNKQIDKFLENLPRSSQENPAKFSNILKKKKIP